MFIYLFIYLLLNFDYIYKALGTFQYSR